LAKVQHLHEKRGITFPEYGALLGTRAMLAAGTLEHGKACHTVPLPHEHQFDMNKSCFAYGCGTVSCIGGTMALIMGMSPSTARSYVSNSSETLRDLFYPQDLHSTKWHRITPRQAVKAIDNWLRTGKPMWKNVLHKATK
jgi:hypothetical protein